MKKTSPAISASDTQPAQPESRAMSNPSGMASGTGTLTGATPARANLTDKIELMDLPPELLTLIMQKAGLSEDAVKLGMTATQLWDIYQRIFTKEEKQYHTIAYNINKYALDQISDSRPAKNITLPFRETDISLKSELQRQRNESVDPRAELIKKAYVKTWDLLLQPETRENPPLASQLMKKLLGLVPHIANPAQFIRNLTVFQNLTYLAAIDIDRCIQLFVTHFPGTYLSVFIADQLHVSTPEADMLIRYLKIHPEDSVLHYACDQYATKNQEDFPALLRTLVTAGCDLEHRGFLGSTALQAAAERGKTEVVKQLIQYGANINTADDGGNTCLMGAYSSHAEPIIQILLQAPHINLAARNISGFTILDRAILEQNEAFIQQLLDRGADVNRSGRSGYTPLMRACWGEGNPAIVRLLLDAGANIDATDGTGRSALDHAIERESLSAIDILLTHSAIQLNPQQTQALARLRSAQEQQ